MNITVMDIFTSQPNFIEVLAMIMFYQIMLSIVKTVINREVP